MFQFPHHRRRLKVDNKGSRLSIVCTQNRLELGGMKIFDQAMSEELRLRKRLQKGLLKLLQRMWFTPYMDDYATTNNNIRSLFGRDVHLLKDLSCQPQCLYFFKFPVKSKF